MEQKVKKLFDFEKVKKNFVDFVEEHPCGERNLTSSRSSEKILDIRQDRIDKEELEELNKNKKIIEQHSQGRYKLEKEIGHGAYSKVYLALDTNTNPNIKVAIKVIN